VSDPTALWKIYDANASFVRPPSMTALGEKLVGKGIILAEGTFGFFFHPECLYLLQVGRRYALPHEAHHAGKALEIYP